MNRRTLCWRALGTGALLLTLGSAVQAQSRYDDRRDAGYSRNAGYRDDRLADDRYQTEIERAERELQRDQRRMTRLEADRRAAYGDKTRMRQIDEKIRVLDAEIEEDRRLLKIARENARAANRGMSEADRREIEKARRELRIDQQRMTRLEADRRAAYGDKEKMRRIDEQIRALGAEINRDRERLRIAMEKARPSTRSNIRWNGARRNDGGRP
jgi:hypothetical protein